MGNNNSKKLFDLIYRNAAIAAITWIIVFTASLIWNISQERESTIDIVKNVARANLNKDLAIRSWSASHGGVYVVPDERTPPNPYLSHLPDRDLVSTTNIKLTLMNPAYMLRQVMNDYENLYGVKGHITSLKLLNLDNAPDEWERNSLLDFERGIREKAGIAHIDGKSYMRLMIPMITKQSCLKCHAHQGYKINEICGGMSVAVPMASYLVIQSKNIRRQVWFHGVIFLIGLLAIGFVTFCSKQRFIERQKSEDDLRRRDAALAKSDVEWTHAMDFFEDAICLIDPDDKVIRTNQSFCSLTGLNQEKIIGQDITSVIHPDGEIVPCPVCVARREKHDSMINMEADNPDNSTGKAIEIMVKMIRDSEQNVVAVLIGIRDLTRYRQAEETRIRLETAIEQANESIIISDKVGTILYVNPSFVKVSGYKKEEALGQNFNIIENGEQDAEFYQKMWGKLGQGLVWKGHLVNKRKDGKLYEEEATISPVFDGRRRIINYVAVKRDVTEEIKMESQLRQSQKMEAIGTLAGGIAHDFNNILGVILGFTDMAMEELSSDSQVVDNLSMVLSAGMRAKELVKQILAFSRQAEHECVPVQISSLIKEALKMLRSSIPATIEIKDNIDQVAGVVWADPTQIHQIIVNLCTNAYHAMREKGGELAVSLTSITLKSQDYLVQRGELIPGPYLLLAVSDTGCGIDKKIVERIFEPYFTTKKKTEGTGLGLAMVHGIVKSLNGQIKVYSEPGKGTTIQVYMPELEKKESLEKVVASDPTPRGNERIIIVDDHEEILFLHKKMLAGLGYDVIAYATGDEAFQAFKSNPNDFDLVLTDMTMPIMTGLDMAEKMLQVRPDLPIILCTGHSELIDGEKAKSVGIREYIMKPILKNDLGKTVRRVLDERK